MTALRTCFDKHIKTRVALQLLLDGLPAFVMALHLLSGYSVKMLTSGWSGEYRILPGTFYYVTLICLMAIPIPAFVLSFIWREKDADLFQQHRWCRWISSLLRIPGAVVIAIAILLDVFLFSAGLMCLYGWICS